MSDHPILFSSPMVRALLAGLKTQTRRIFKPQPPADARYTGIHFSSDEPDSFFFNSPSGPFKVPKRFAEGDRLWVREAFTEVGSSDPGFFITRADYPECAARYGWDKTPATIEEAGGRWKPSIHMPRKLSRLTLTITEVRVQRLLDISEADAEAEGCVKLPASGRAVMTKGDQYFGRTWPSCRAWFHEVWDEINGPGTWAANPSIIALSFTVERKNIDG